MTENEFDELFDAVKHCIEQSIDASGADIECNLNDPVLELKFAVDSQIILNRHAPNREIWLAAKSGSLHYAIQDGLWVSRRDGSELFGKLEELVQVGSGELVTFGFEVRFCRG